MLLKIRELNAGILIELMLEGCGFTAAMINFSYCAVVRVCRARFDLPITLIDLNNMYSHYFSSLWSLHAC